MNKAAKTAKTTVSSEKKDVRRDAATQGAEARRWRRELAAAATYADPKTIRTIKFPLQQVSVDSWPALQSLGRVVNSSAHGSLIGYLFALYAGGFLLFGKQSEAEAFRNGGVLNDEEWKESVVTQSELTISASTFVPSAIYQRLLVTPRAVGGKNVDFKPDVIAIEWEKYFCKGKSGEKIPEPEQKLFTAIGRELAQRFDSWAALAGDVVGAASAVDKALRQLAYPISSRTLAARIGGLRPCEPACSLAHNPGAILLDDVAGIAPHVMAAQAFFRARNQGVESAKELIKYVQIAFTGDPNHGGLSWVFGKGLNYFRETSTTQIMADFGIAEKWRSAIDAIRNQALAIPIAQTTFFADASYSPYRSKLGGLLTSWVANYANRLFDLDAILSSEIDPFELPSSLLDDDALLLELGTRRDDISALLADALSRRQLITESLDRLFGKAPGMSQSDIDIIEGYNDELSSLAGTLNMIKARIDMLIEAAERRNESKTKDVLETYRFDLPKWIRPLERLNRLNLEPSDPQQTLDKACAEFALLHNAMHEQYDRLKQWAALTGETLDVMKRQAVREGDRIREAKSKKNPDEMAIRACLNMLGAAARRCSEETITAVARWMGDRPIFAEQSHLNQYLFNRRGKIYKSVYDKGPSQPFALKQEVLDRASEFLNDFGLFVAGLRQQYLSTGSPSLRHLTDLYTLERAWFNVLMLGFPDSIPSELALPEAVKEVFSLPTDLVLALRRKTVTSSVLRKVFNHYYVRLSELSAKLFRERWYLDAQFARAGDNALIYGCPSGRDVWTPPSHYFESTKPIGDALRLIRDAATDGLSGQVNPEQALAFVIAQREKSLAEQSARDYLREAPHKWFYAWPSGDTINGLRIGKEGIGKRVTKMHAAALTGQRHYMGVLDTMLARPEEVSIGDINVNVRQYFTQHVKRSDAGHFMVELIPDELQVDIAIPVAETRKSAEMNPFQRYVAIDLGERGLAYAVFDAVSHEEMARGRWGIRQMRSLVADELAGRRKRSDSSKFGAKFDKAEIQRRETVVGEYCHAINSLMRHYSAFPVLEYAAGGAGGNIDKVYAAVIEHYLFSGTPTVDAARASYWSGASVWKHPTLLQKKYDKAVAKRTEQLEPLSMFPGVGVGAAGTSQECSCCRRNPVKMAREWIERRPKGVAITVDANGEVTLGEQGTIRLRKSAPVEDRAAYRRGNQRTPLSEPLGQMVITGDDLLRQIRRNLRQAPLSKQTQDTTNSVYQCLFVDCGKRIHADENAAVNIGYRFKMARP